MNCESESCPITLNTTRICAKDAISMSIEISKIGFANMKPNAVILVNHEEVFDGIAATSLVHFPINAALLFTEGNNLRKETLNEIQRLSPKGYKGIHVILVGKISKSVSSELNSYGFKTFHISGDNHYETACMISQVRKEFKNILIMSGENYSEGIISGYWSAHHGDPILFVKKDKISSCTLEVIKKMRDINIYIVGSNKTISKSAEKYLSQLDNVKCINRIDGNTPYEIAVNFAMYKDYRTDFGWGRNYKEGHAFTFGELHHPMEIIAGVLFAHMGKHTPLLLTKKDQIPEVVERYINSVKPTPHKDMPRPPFMHGFILGPTKDISYKAQIMIEDSLSIDHEMMAMKNHMHESKCMCDSEYGDTHHNMDHEDHMMCMKQDKDKLEGKSMNSQDHMAGMKHDMHESKCMCDSENMEMHHDMDHEEHMMCMKHDKDKPEGKAMYSQDYMVGMKPYMHESKCMCDSGNMEMHHEMDLEDHMIYMKQDKDKPEGKAMYCQDNMEEIKYDMHESKCMCDSGNMEMHHNMDHEGHMMCMKQDKDEQECKAMHSQDHMVGMKHDMNESKCMCDSEYGDTHHNMDHEEHMMCMKHEKDEPEGKVMHIQGHMAGMKYDMHESKCMCNSECGGMHHMDHEDHMMCMKHEKDEPEGKAMYSQDHMVGMKPDMHESKCMCNSGNMEMHHDMDHEDHMMCMKQDKDEQECKAMHSQDHMAGMKHDMHESKCMCDSGNMEMHHDMDHEEHMMCMKHDKDEQEGKVKHIQGHMDKYSGSQFIIVNIDEILG